MDHHEQHHQHHEKEREEHVRHEKEREREAEQGPAKIHPVWFLVLGTVLIGLVVVIWILAVP